LRKLCITLLCAVFLAGPAAAQQVSIIRDAEAENTIRAYAAPIFRAAGYDPKQIKVHIVNDKSLNAFVTNGMNMYMNTGLLIRAETPDQVAGVMAHELGHIIGGHLARFDERMRQAQKQSIATFLLGGIAAAVTGRGDAAMAVISGGQQALMGSVMQYSQTQESSADQAGLKYMDQAGMSARGLADFFRVLEGQELLTVGRQDPYMRTHPVTRQRIQTVDEHVARSPYTNTPMGPAFVEMHKRMKAKLIGFLEPITVVLQKYPESDVSLEGRYARAIAYYRRPDMAKALELVDGLLADHPNDPYFLELKGQMLFENGRIAEALPPYQASVKALPDSALLRTSLAQVLIETNEPANIKTAIVQLEESKKIEDENGLTMRLMAVAYGRDGQTGMASLSIAELALLQGRYNEAKVQADRALQNLKNGSPPWQRASDVKEQAERGSKEQ
jgi:predicted Zn-dependent protease